MPLRTNPITGEPILYAPDRAARPRDPSPERCPFCPGHEADTPPEILHSGDPWRIRVFPNKYPPIEGAEVIVESPGHDIAFDEIEHADEVVRTYLQRYRAHGDAAYAALFKNEGRAAGATIPHVHSQLVPLPFVPPRIARESEAFARAARCPLCADAGTALRETATFTWIAPAYQQWIVPRRHVNELTMLHDDELADLAELLRDAARASRKVAFNWMFMNFRGESAGHFYVEVFLRVGTIAGLELGTGTFVDIGPSPLSPAPRGRG